MNYQELKEWQDLDHCNDGLIESIERLIDVYIDDLKDLSVEVRRELYFCDEAFRITDSVWDTVLNTGRIDSEYYEPDKKDLSKAITILDYAEDKSFIAQDSGLWENLNPKASLVSQAFFSLENVIRDKLRESNLNGLNE